VLDPDRKKMSKSKGNVVTPMGLLEEHGSDGVRYWAASGRPGMDTAFDAGQMKVGRRLAMKLLNASRFTLAQAEPRGPVAVPVDRAMLTSLAALVKECTALLDDCQYATVLERTERWFWSFCDDYLELVKSRRYGASGPEPAGSANTALVAALSVLLRLFAPFLPFVTEEVWSWWQEGSVHRATWPEAAELLDLIGGADDRASAALERAALVLGEVRKTKSEAKRKLSTPVARLVVRDTADNLRALQTAESDLRSSGFVEQLVTEAADVFSVEVTLADPEPTAAGPAAS
jgi:valyl-tRNA synthetase